MADFERLKNAMADIEEDVVLEICEEILASGEGVNEAIAACQDGIAVVGDRFESGEYYVGDLVYSGEVMSQAMAKLRPLMVSQGGGAIGRMVFCTVEGDLHDIGKNIVKAMLEAANFDVVDLGIDTKPQLIIDTLKAQNIRLLALSGVLTLAIESMKDTVAKVKAAGLTDVKIIIGGAPVSEGSRAYVGADAWSQNPTETVRICKDWAQNLV